MRARWLVGVGALAAACSSGVPPATRAEVRNTCKITSDCALYQRDVPLTCTRGQCVTSGAFLSVARLTSTPYPYTLAIAMPPTSSYQPGTTTVVKSTELALFPAATTICTGDATMNTCVALPQTGTYGGLYDVDQQTALDVGRFVGNSDVTLPVHATYTLLTEDGTKATTRRSTGIPVYSYYANLTNEPIVAGQPGGPDGSAPIDFTAQLPPGRYLRDIAIDPPFNDSFPPWSDVVTSDLHVPLAVKVGATSDYVLSGYIAPLKARFVSADNKTPTGHFVCGGNDCTGWTATLIDQASGRLTSNIHTFRSSNGGDFSLFNVVPKSSIHDDALTLAGQALLLAPPAGQILPSILSTAVQGDISGAQSYPAVQVAAAVSGHVRQQLDSDASSDGTPLKATIDFASNDDAFQLLYANTPLVYRTSVVTAADGSYTVQLPRGTYDIAVTPDASGAPLPVTYGQIVVATTSLGGVDNLTQTALDIVVRPAFELTGRVTTADGRALAGVPVAALRTSSATTPNVPSKLADLARAAWATTDANGVYSLPLDPGTYDVFAKAPAASGYAWSVAPAAAVVAPGAPLPDPVDFAVPAPFDASMRIYDPGGGFIQGALVQVFAALDPANPNSPQVQIGEGTTDSQGALVLYLPPKFPE